MKIIGLTGSIAMGKSATAAMFKQAGCFVHDADSAVHELYSGIAVPWFETHFPHVVVNKSVSRETLSAHLKNKPEDLKIIEAYIHPLLTQHRHEKTRKAKEKIIVYDMPLLFETGMQNQVDVRVTVSCAPELQKQRALERPNMTEEKLKFILNLQWADAKKRLNSHCILTTDIDLATTNRQVTDLLRAIR
jgi:dephospho-CoA kinase